MPAAISAFSFNPVAAATAASFSSSHCLQAGDKPDI